MSNDITVTLPAASNSLLINNSAAESNENSTTKSTLVVSSVVTPSGQSASVATVSGAGITAAGFNVNSNNNSNTFNRSDSGSSSNKITDTEKPSTKTGSDDCNKECPTPKFGGSRRNSSKTRHCTSLPIFHNASELCEIGSQPGMECMPLRTPPGPYHHYHHVADQTKSLQELQNEVGALLEFRDLVIETFPDLKHKMASMSATNTLTGMASSSSLASRREWEPGIRVKRKITPKENAASAAAEMVVSSSLIRSRSNSHSGKKEPKSGEGNGSVVQDSGFSTETSSSKEAHSASSTTGAMQGTVASNRLPPDTDDELLNLLDVIHRKSNRLRDEVEYLQNLERDNKFSTNKNFNTNSSSSNNSSDNCLHKQFQEHVDKLNREDFQQLRKERDRLLDKLAEMEAETLTGRIKATQMQDQFEELFTAKKELEEQLKLALSQKLELSSRLHELQRQYSGSGGSKGSSSQLESNRQQPTHLQGASSSSFSSSYHQLLTNRFGGTVTTATFQPVVVESATATATTTTPDDNLHNHKTTLYPFHSSNSCSSDIINISQQKQLASRDDLLLKNLGRLDGLISSPNRISKVRSLTDSKKIAAILLETNVLELQRHLLTLTVQNQILTQKLEQATKSKIFLLKKLDKSKEEIDDVRFQLEEKDIELEGTKAQLRVLESKIPLKLDFNTTMSSETNRSSSTMILSSSRDSPITPTQISTPSMKAMIPLPMDEIQQHSSSTESAQDQTERTDSRLGSNSGSGPETPKRSRPSKIPLPGTKGYLAPKPPTGRSPAASTASSAATTPYQKSPSGICGGYGSCGGPVSNKSLSRSTGNLYGKSGPPSVKRFGDSTSTSLHRPESAQSNTKDNSLTGGGCGLNTSSRSSSSSIPISSSTKSTPSPHKMMISNSPLPRPKRDSLTSRVRHLDSLSRVHNNVGTSSASTPSSPLNNHNNNNNSSNSSSSNINLISTNTTSNYSRKDLSSSFTQGQLRDRIGGDNRNNKQTTATTTNSTISVRRVSSASIGRGSSSNADQQQQHQQQQNETESGKINKIRKIESMDSLFDDDYSNEIQQRQQQFNSRNLINEFIAKTSQNPPAIFKLSFVPPYTSCDEDQIELAYKHPQLLFDLEMNEPATSHQKHSEFSAGDEVNDDDESEVGVKSLNSNSAATTTTTTPNYQTNKGIEVKYFKHSQGNLNPTQNFLRRTISTANFYVKNHHYPAAVVPPTKLILPVDNGSNCGEDDRRSPCKLIGKVNPAIARTWEQLSALQHTNRHLSRSVSNMSDDSEKLFFHHPAVQESKSNFHVNKVIYSEEENSVEEECGEGGREEAEQEKYEEQEDLSDEESSEDSDDDDGYSGNFYDSIDDDDDAVDSDYCRVGDIFPIAYPKQQQQIDAGEEMAEFNSIEKKKCYWSLESEIK